MLQSTPAIQDSTNTMAVLAALAEYAASFTIAGEAAMETARHCLIDALARGLDALRDPECAALVGPIVPGAVLPGGARVPGTSLELEPSQAAFCIGLMLCRPAGGEQWLGASGACASDALGAILAAADYQARKATMEGRPPPKVRTLLAAMLKAQEIQSALAAAAEEHYAAGAALRLGRVAAAAIVVAQLGGTLAQSIRAISWACIDGDAHAHAHQPYAIGRRDWAWGDALGRAVRHAFQSLAAGRPSELTADDLGAVELAGLLLRAQRLSPKSAFGRALIDRLAGRGNPRQLEQLAARFRAAVDRSFPTRQAERVKGLFAAPERLDDLPVNELIAALVTNGARRR